MKPKHTPVLLLIGFLGFCLLQACKAIIEPDISNRIVTLEAPGDQFQSTSYAIGFWWDVVGDALTYELQVVTPSFNNIGSLVLDTTLTGNKFTVNLSPGSYQWRVKALNGSSQTAYSAPKSFVIVASSITKQSVQLSSPSNNLLTNQSPLIFSWGNLYGATKYQLEIDTNNFINESLAVYNQTIPGQQLSFTFPKDQTYQWRVRAENDTAVAQWSAVNTVTYDHTPPGRVTVTAPANNIVTPLPVTLQWNAAATASRYKLYAFKGDSVTTYSATFPLLINTTNYSFVTGNSGDRVYWKVTAIDAAGNEGQASILRSFVLQ